MSTASSGLVSDDFPAGLRVLVVDDDPTCLLILAKMLRSCKYEVTKCKQADVALSLLRENKNGYDIVLSDVHMPDMDGFKLLEHIGLEMDLPVIMMSADDGKDVVMKGVTHGACDYLIKPVRIEALKTIWQHVFRKRKNEWKDMEQTGSAEDADRNQKPSEETDYSSSANEGNWKISKKRSNEEDENDERDDSSTLKKPRVVWSVELHQQFVAAVNQLGIEKAVPKKILELMNVPGLTRENVASHLQKYRLYLRRLSGVSQHQSNMNNSFLGPQGTAFGPLSMLSATDLQTLAATGQFAALQAASLSRSTVKTGMPIALTDQRNIFSFENPKLSFLEGQQHLSSAKQVNLLRGVPATMEPKPLGQGGQSSSVLMQMAHSQLGVQILSDINNNNIPQVPTSLSQPIGSNGVAGGSLVRNGSENQGGSEYNSIPQTSSVLKFPVGHTTDLPVNSYPLGSIHEISTVAPKDTFQGEITSGIRSYGGFMPVNDPFRDLHHSKTSELKLHNVGLSFTASQPRNSLRANVDQSQLDLIHGRFSPGQSIMQNMDASTVGKSMLSVGEGMGQSNSQSVVQNFSTFVENSVEVKTESVADASYQTTFVPESFGQEDLMSALLKQQQGGGVQAENEFDFGGYSMDNIPV